MKLVPFLVVIHLFVASAFAQVQEYTVSEIKFLAYDFNLQTWKAGWFTANGHKEAKIQISRESVVYTITPKDPNSPARVVTFTLPGGSSNSTLGFKWHSTGYMLSTYRDSTATGASISSKDVSFADLLSRRFSTASICLSGSGELQMRECVTIVGSGDIAARSSETDRIRATGIARRESTNQLKPEGSTDEYRTYYGGYAKETTVTYVNPNDHSIKEMSRDEISEYVNCFHDSEFRARGSLSRRLERNLKAQNRDWLDWNPGRALQRRVKSEGETRYEIEKCTKSVAEARRAQEEEVREIEAQEEEDEKQEEEDGRRRAAREKAAKQKKLGQDIGNVIIELMKKKKQP